MAVKTSTPWWVSGLLALLQQVDGVPGRDAGARLVRASGGGIDACASLLRVRAAVRAPPRELPGACQAMVAARAGPAGP